MRAELYQSRQPAGLNERSLASSQTCIPHTYQTAVTSFRVVHAGGASWPHPPDIKSLRSRLARIMANLPPGKKEARVKPVYLVSGFVCVGLGAIGIVLPLLPTVPFFILAAFCFARSNPALERRLLDHPRYGPSLRLWRERGAISRRAKWAATGAFAASIAIGFLFSSWPWTLAPPLVALVSGTWLWRRPES